MFLDHLHLLRIEQQHIGQLALQQAEFAADMNCSHILFHCLPPQRARERIHVNLGIAHTICLLDFFGIMPYKVPANQSMIGSQHRTSKVPIYRKDPGWSVLLRDSSSHQTAITDHTAHLNPTPPQSQFRA